MTRTVHLFAGPSLHGTPHQSVTAGPDAQGRPLVWWPPARRGDAETLVRSQAIPGILALADGTFHSHPAIGHIELRQAMERGWIVVGLCSMGAIRACEMGHLGMRAWGTVARLFRERPQRPDDEVALLHAAEAPWQPLSEPLIHVLEYLQRMQALGALDPVAAQRIEAGLRERWYGSRTLAALHTMLKEHAPVGQRSTLLERAADFRPYRLKQQDLESFVAANPWAWSDGEWAAL